MGQVECVERKIFASPLCRTKKILYRIWATICIAIITLPAHTSLLYQKCPVFSDHTWFTYCYGLQMVLCDRKHALWDVAFTLRIARQNSVPSIIVPTSIWKGNLFTYEQCKATFLDGNQLIYHAWKAHQSEPTNYQRLPVICISLLRNMQLLVIFYQGSCLDTNNARSVWLSSCNYRFQTLDPTHL